MRMPYVLRQQISHVDDDADADDANDHDETDDHIDNNYNTTTDRPTNHNL